MKHGGRVDYDRVCHLPGLPLDVYNDDSEDSVIFPKELYEFNHFKLQEQDFQCNLVLSVP